MAICEKCQHCRREKEEEVKRFKEKFMDGGIVEKGPQCKECDHVEGDNLERCVICGDVLKKD